MNLQKYKLKIIAIFIILILAFGTGYCVAKYKIEQDILVGSKVAVPVLEVEGTETTKISAINNTGYYDFTVKNYNQEKITDVALNYEIEVISKADESISFKLYNEEKQIDLKNNKTEKIYINNKEKEEHTYRLEVVYDKNKSTSKQDILEDVQIKVYSEQAKI